MKQQAFTLPKHFGQLHFSYIRIPRKKKKELKKFMASQIGWSWLNLNESLWLKLGVENREYRDFLIQQLCLQYE